MQKFEYDKVLKWRPIARNPMNQNGSVNCKAHGIEFRNMGDVDATIDGFWTLRAGGEPKTFFIDSPKMVLENEFQITFDDKQTGVKKVEICETVIKGFNYDLV
jgi:hypothetical protein